MQSYNHHRRHSPIGGTPISRRHNRLDITSWDHCQHPIWRSWRAYRYREPSVRAASATEASDRLVRTINDARTIKRTHDRRFAEVFDPFDDALPSPQSHHAKEERNERGAPHPDALGAGKPSNPVREERTDAGLPLLLTLLECIETSPQFKRLSGALLCIKPGLNLQILGVLRARESFIACTFSGLSSNLSGTREN